MPILPPWLNYVSPAASILALVVSIISLVIAGMTYRRAAPRVSVSYYIDRGVRESDGSSASSYVRLTIVLYNRGLAPVGVDGFILDRAVKGRLGAWPLVWFVGSDHTLLEGEELSTTLAPSSSLGWTFEIRSVNGRRTVGRYADVDDMLRALRYTTLKVHLGNNSELRRMRIRIVDDERLERIDRWFKDVDKRMDSRTKRYERWVDEKLGPRP